MESIILHDRLLLFLLNSSLESGCDYALQTIERLKTKNRVIVYSLSQPITWKDFVSLNFTALKKIVQTSNGFIEIHPLFLVPGRKWRWIEDINHWLNLSLIGLFLRVWFLGYKKILWFFEPFHIPTVLPLFYGFTTFFDCVDYFPGFSTYAKRCFYQIIDKVKVVTANSFVLFTFIKKMRKDVVLVPQGFTLDLFKDYQLPSTTQNKKRKRAFTVGFLGGISSRINFNLLAATAQLASTTTFKLVGALEPNVFEREDDLQQQLETVKKLPNVKIVPPVAKNDVPATLKQFDVGVIPYNVENAFNSYSFPMKALEYLYAGLPVISTRIKELERYQIAVTIVDSPEAFAQVIHSLKTRPLSTAQQRLHQHLAARHSWENKLTVISLLLKKF